MTKRSPEELRAGQRRAHRLPRRFTVRVAGVSFRNGYLDRMNFLGDLATDLRQLQAEPAARNRLIDEHLAVVERALIEGAIPAELNREPDNEADPLAVSITIPVVPEVGVVGYVPATTSGCLAPLLARDMDEGGRWEAIIPLDGIKIDRNHPDRPGVEVTIYRVAD